MNRAPVNNNKLFSAIKRHYNNEYCFKIRSTKAYPLFVLSMAERGREDGEQYYNRYRGSLTLNKLPLVTSCNHFFNYQIIMGLNPKAKWVKDAHIGSKTQPNIQQLL